MSEVPPPLPSSPPTVAGPVGAPQYEPGPAGEFRVGEAFATGWAALKANYLVLVGATLLFMLIYVVGTVIAAFIPVVGSLSGFLLAPLVASYSYLYVSAVRGEVVQINNAFGVLSGKFWWLVLMQLLVALISGAALIPMIIGIVVVVIAVQAGTEMLTVGVGIGGLIGLALLVAYLYLAARLMFTGLLYLDAPVGSLDIIECLKMCWRGTRACAWPLVGMTVLIVVVVVLSTLLLGVGFLLLGLPLGWAAVGAAYDRLFPRRHMADWRPSADLAGPAAALP